nr:granule-bound starch synthase 1, chloroplastic/amyloplastic [Tanacetum cinerariifolium]
MTTATAWNCVTRRSSVNNGVAIFANKSEVIGAKKVQNWNSRKLIVCGAGMNLVFVGAEVGPWSKTGGLGDVLGGLPPAMAANGHRVMTVSPRYDQYKDAWDTEVEVELKAGDKTEKVRFFHCYKRGVDRVFVDHPLQMKKDQKYVIENLTNCDILIMRRNGRVDSLRDRKPERDINPHIPIRQTSTYEERMQELVYDDLFCTICGHERLANGFFAQFTYAELTFATYGFSRKYLLSKQRKRVYKGTLRSGLQIVIRKHFFATIKEEDFRLKIALGTSKGLEYLHSRNIYGSVRPRNILLTHDFQPQLANFGLTKNPYEDLNHLSETRVLKTFEYLAPEYDETGTDSSKTDVYSFGVVLLELLTGRKTPEETNGESFLRWARPLLAQKVYMDLVDPATREETHLLQLVLIVRLLENCLSYDPHERCSIAEVVTDLRNIVEINDH